MVTKHRILIKTVGETLDYIISGKCEITDSQTINVFEQRNRWITADNQRLLVFKKLHKLGKCQTIDTVVTFNIKPTKCHILSSNRVRGYEGGTLWRSQESKHNNSDCRMSVTSFISQREASLDSISLSNRTEYSSESSSKMCSVSDRTLCGNRGIVRRTGCYGLVATSLKYQTTMTVSKFSTSFKSVYQTSGETLE